MKSLCTLTLQIHGFVDLKLLTAIGNDTKIILASQDKEMVACFTLIIKMCFSAILGLLHS